MGIPSMLPCIEMVFISVFLAWAYSVRPYLIKNFRGSSVEAVQVLTSYQGGILGVRAFLAIMNPMETINGILFAFQLLVDGSGNRGRTYDAGYN